MKIYQAPNKIINVCFIQNDSTNIDLYKQIFNWSKEYLNFEIQYFEKENLNNLEEIWKSNHDFVFVDYDIEFEELFAWNFYSKKHEINREFKLVFLLNQYSDKDYILFKNGADDLVYNNGNFIDIKWKIFSILRIKWDFSHKQTTLIHNGVIIDLVKRIVISNNKEINITKKEFQLLEILVDEFNNKKRFVSKSKIFKQIYNSNIVDNTRVIDQLIFRLKSKFNRDFFQIEPKKGIKIK